MKNLSPAIIGAIALGMYCAVPHAQTASAQSAQAKTERVATPARAAMKRGDRKFLEEVAQHSIAEVQSGKIAAARGTNPQVNKFGRMMVQDHGKTYEEVVQLARAKAVSLPGQLDRGNTREAEKLQKLSGPEFDREYMAAMVKDHEEDVKDFRKMSRNAKDPDVRAFAQKTLPLLEGHLMMARDVNVAARKAK